MANIETIIQQLQIDVASLQESNEAINGYLDSVTTTVDANYAEILNKIGSIEEKMRSLESYLVSLDSFHALELRVTAIEELLQE